MTSKQVTSPPWNSRKLLHSKDINDPNMIKHWAYKRAPGHQNNNSKFKRK